MKKITYIISSLILLSFLSCKDENLPNASLDKWEVIDLQAMPQDEAVTVSWSVMNEIYPEGFYLQWEPTSSALVGGEMELENNTLSYLINDLVNDETYKFSVQAIYANNTRSGKVEVKARPISSRPAPTNLVGIPGDKKVTLQWLKPDNDALIEYKLSYSQGNQKVTISNDLEEYEVKNLINDTEYDFTLIALYPNGESEIVSTSTTPTSTPFDYLWSEVALKSGDFSGYTKTSNPVFSPDGRTLYLPTSTPNGHLFAVDVLTGVIKWVFSINEVTYGGGALVGPDGTIYQGSDKAIYAINPDGSQKWKVESTGAGAQARIRAFPTISSDGVLFMLSNSKIYALQSQDGSELWSKELPNNATTGSALLLGNNKLLYVGTNKGVFALKSQDGSSVWSNTTSVLNVTENGSMAIDGTTLYAALKGKAGVAAINTDDGNLKWNSQSQGDAYFPIVGKDGVVYHTEKSGNANVYALNPNGSNKWSKTIGASLNYGGLVLDDNGIIYGGTQGKLDGNYKMYAINTRNGEFEFINNSSQQIMAAFSLGPDKRVYYGTIGKSVSDRGSIQSYEANASLESQSWSIRGGDLQGTNRQK